EIEMVSAHRVVLYWYGAVLEHRRGQGLAGKMRIEIGQHEPAHLLPGFRGRRADMRHDEQIPGSQQIGGDVRLAVKYIQRRAAQPALAQSAGQLDLIDQSAAGDIDQQAIGTERIK